jgi:hypothetical protein
MPTWRGNTYRFTVTAANATAGATYTNNGQTFTVTDTITAGTILYCFGTGAPTANGTLTFATGIGDATITFSANTAPNTAWGTATNWLENAIPTGTTDAIFDPNSRDCTMGANRTCRDLTFTAYPNTLTISTFTLQANRNVTLQSDISSRISGTTGTLSMAVFGAGLSGTITSNGGTWPLNYSTSGQSITITFADPFTCTGNASISSAPTYSGSTFSVNGNFTSSGGGSLVASSTNFIMTGTGTLSLAGVCNMELNTTGTITISGNITAGRRFIITAVGSLVGLSTANLTFVSGSSEGIIDLGGRTVQDFNTNTSVNTYTIRSSFTCRNISLLAATYNGPIAPSTATITVEGNYNIAAITTTNGRLDIVMNGATGTATIANGATFTGIPVTINAGSNTITYAGTVNFREGCSVTRTSGLINAGLTTSTIINPATVVTISGMIFNNLTITPTSITITQNAQNTINGVLSLGGTVIFAGTHGFDNRDFVCTTAGSTITFSNANANPSAAYLITGSLTLIGTLASRITLQAAGSASFTGTANGTALTYASGTAPSVGMTISQATGQAPAGLLSLLPSRPTITGGTSPNFTISPSVTPTTGSIAMRAGFKAIFTLQSGATQNVAYTTTQDIDSSQGQTILSFGSNGDALSSNVSLFRTLNWGPLVAPSGSVAFTWVN